MSKYSFYLLATFIFAILSLPSANAQETELGHVINNVSLECDIVKLSINTHSNMELVRISLTNISVPNLIPVLNASDSSCLRVSILNHSGKIIGRRQYYLEDFKLKTGADSLHLGQEYTILESVTPEQLPIDNFGGIIRVEFWLADSEQPSKIYHVTGEILKPKERNNLK